jgi:membrane-associated protein
METIWLFSGYNLAAGNITVEHILLFYTVGILGRLAGAIILFYICRFGIAPIFLRYIKPRLIKIIDNFPTLQKLSHLVTSHYIKSTISGVNESRPLHLFGRKFNLSPLTVAMGRFLWMRLPITIILSARKQRTVLILGVAIFSVVWDGAYIIFGILGGKGGLAPIQMFLYPLSAMALISVLLYSFRWLKISIHPVSLG